MTRRATFATYRVMGRILVIMSLVCVASLSAASTTGASGRVTSSRQVMRVGHALLGTVSGRIDRPLGQRMVSRTTAKIAPSLNWSGLVQFGSRIEGAEASWTVPSVQASSSSLYSSTWVGVDGGRSEEHTS